MNTHRLLVAAAVASMFGCIPAHAQLGGLLEKVLPQVVRGAASEVAPSPVPEATETPRGGKSRSLSGSGTAAAGANAPALTGDLPPDRQCNRPQERFNVMEKVVEYGGTEAALRLEKLIKSDYKYDDLTPQDRAMLKFLAQTTVWVPVEVETKLANVFDKLQSRGEGANEEQEMTREKIAARLNRLKASLTDFPVDIRLTVNSGLSDGAWAKFGGVIQIAPTFAETMMTHVQGGDLVLAHELSHIYKRHPVKKMQFELLASREGWELGKRVLGRAMRGTQIDPLADATFVVTTLPKLVNFVRSMQLTFSREQELEADACAIIWLRAAGENPVPAWDQFVTQFASKDAAKTSYGASHPATPEREANFKTKLGEKPASPGAKPVKRPAKAAPGEKG